MLTKDLATNDIQALHDTDTIKDALEIINKNKVSHVPVISKHNEYIGLFEEEMADNFPVDTLLKEVTLLDAVSTRIYEYQHFYQVFDLIYSENLSLIPVLNDNNIYTGCITQQVILENIANVLSLHEYGGIIVLEIKYRDYSLTQIAQIIESNGAKILTLCTTTDATNESFEVTIKVNTSEITSILETFMRYDYTVKSFFGEYNKLEDLYRTRIDDFLKYINT